MDFPGRQSGKLLFMTQAATHQKISVKPRSASLGAVIDGVDLAQDLSDSTLEELKSVFGRYSVIFFRNQDLTPQQHIDLAERWGSINVNRFFKPLEGYPKIAQVIKEADQKENIGERGIRITLTMRSPRWARSSMRAKCRKLAATHFSQACILLMRPCLTA